METLWRIELLGGLRVRQDDRVITRFRYQKAASLLAYLACHPDRAHRRELLIDLLWPAEDPEVTRLRLRVALSSLRRELESLPRGHVLVADRVSVSLSSAACSTDVAEFEVALAAAGRAASACERIPLFIKALEHYPGELLPGFPEEWIFAERERLTEAYLRAAESLVECLEARPNLDGALDYAQRAVAVAPHREEAHRMLIRVLLARGEPFAALQQYSRLEKLLQEQFGATPSAATRALVARSVLAGKPAVDRVKRVPAEEPPLPSIEPGLPGNLPVPLSRFFGRQSEIATLCAMLRQEARRLVTLTGPGGSGKTRLAIEAAACIARDPLREATWFVSLADLADGARIADAVLTALRLSRSPEAEPMEQVVAFLARRPALLVLDNLEHLLPAAANMVRELLERVPSLACLVTSRHGLGLAGEREFPVAPLPTPTSGIQVFGPSGVQATDPECPLPPERLNARTPERLLQCPSTQLFIDRAQAVVPDFEVTPANADAVAALCDRLEGLPLAIELAAPWVRLLTPEQILARLGQPFELLVCRQQLPPPRHQSLWAALDWSYRLLSPALQRFFERLSVFRGGWSLEAAEAVCSDGGLRYQDLGLRGARADRAEEQPDLRPKAQGLTPDAQHPSPGVLDSLTHLRDGSLVVVEEGREGLRCRFLETVRQFAEEKLRASGEEATWRERHWAWCMELAEGTGAGLQAPRDPAALDRLEQEHDNLRAALTWCRTRGDAERGLALATALPIFWQSRFRAAEGREQLEALLALPAAVPLTKLRMKALFGIGYLAWHRGDYPAARARLEVCLALSRMLGDLDLRVDALYFLGRVLLDLDGEVAEARRLFEEALGIERARGNHQSAARFLSSIGGVAHAVGDYAAARARWEECLAGYRECGDVANVTCVVRRLGFLAHEQGDYQQACKLLAESLALFRPAAGAGPGSLRSRAQCAVRGAQHDISFGVRAAHRALRTAHASAASLPSTTGRLSRAALAMMEQWRELRRELKGGVRDVLLLVGRAAYDHGEYHAARHSWEESLGLSREARDRRGAVIALIHVGEVLRLQGDFRGARALLEESRAISEESGYRRRRADALQALGALESDAGSLAAARSLLEESLTLYRPLGHRWQLALALIERGTLARREGEHETAQEFLGESLGMLRALGRKSGLARALISRSQLACAQGAPRAARPLLHESLMLLTELGHRPGIAESLETLAAAEIFESRPARAARLLGAAAALRKSAGVPLPPVERPIYEGLVGRARAELGLDASAAAWTEGERMSFEQVAADALEAARSD